MGTKSVRLDEDVYARVKAEKRDDESLSDTINRLIDGGSILDLYGLGSEDRVAEMEAAIDEAKETSRAKIDELRKRARGE